MAITTGVSGGAWDLFVETAYDKAANWYLRDEPQWRQLIDYHPVDQAMPGEVVTLSLHNELSHATTPLTDGVDVTPVALPAPTRVQVTLQEWGNAATTTLRLAKTAFNGVEKDKAMALGYNMLDSMDDIVRAVADAGTNVVYVNGGAVKTSGGSDGAVATTDLLTRTPATIAVKLLRRNKVRPKQAGRYVAVIHPDVAFDLQAENSATAWNAPHTYGTDTQEIYTGTIGDFQGARYIETTRTTINATAGVGSKPVYSTYYFGQEALVEAAVEQPHAVVGPVTDTLKRFYPLGWYALSGYSVYRQAALLRVRTASSIEDL